MLIVMLLYDTISWSILVEIENHWTGSNDLFTSFSLLDF